MIFMIVILYILSWFRGIPLSDLPEYRRLVGGTWELWRVLHHDASVGVEWFNVPDHENYADQQPTKSCMGLTSLRRERYDEVLFCAPHTSPCSPVVRLNESRICLPRFLPASWIA